MATEQDRSVILDRKRLIAILRDAFRPLRNKHPTSADRVRVPKVWKFTKRRNYRMFGIVQPPDIPSIIPTSRFGNLR